MRNILLLLALFATLIATPSMAQNFPALTGRVMDTANLLDPTQEQALTAKLAALETQTQRQFVVTTIPDLGNYDIADYGYRLGRAWKLGNKDRDDGLLLIIAPNSRKVRFEVAYGLEGVMTDAMSNDIIQRDILPRFRNKDFAGGINAGVDKAIVQLKLTPEEAAKIAAATKKQSRRSQGPDMGSIIFLLFLFFVVILPVMRSFRGGRRYEGANVPIIIWGGDNDWGGGGGSSWGSGGGFGGGGFSGGGGSFGGGGASGGW